MPFIAQDNEDKDKNQQEQQSGQTNGTVLGAPSAAMDAGGKQQVGATGQKVEQPTSSGSFTNLNKYLTANQGAAEGMGGAIKGKVEEKWDKATTTGEAAKTAGAQAATAGTITDTQGTTGKMTAGDYAGVTQNGDFDTLYNAQYGGPQTASEVDGWSDAAQNYADAGTYADFADDGDNGRRELLTDVYGTDGKQYTGGEQTLDSYLLGGTNTLDGVAEQYGTAKADEAFGGITDFLHGEIARGIQTTDGTREAFRGAVGGRVDNAVAAAARGDDKAAARNVREEFLRQIAQPGGWNNSHITEAQALGELGYGDDIIRAVEDGLISVDDLFADTLPKTGATMMSDASFEDYGALKALLDGTTAPGLAGLDSRNSPGVTPPGGLQILASGYERVARGLSATATPFEQSSALEGLARSGLNGSEARDALAVFRADPKAAQKFMRPDPASPTGFRIDPALFTSPEYKNVFY